MAADWEKYSFYTILGVESGARADEIEKAHRLITSSLEPDARADDEKREAAMALVAADAALGVLCDDEARRDHDARLESVLKAASGKKKIETRRKGKLQEQQSVEDDVKLQKATAAMDSAVGALIDSYYERLFARARESRFESITAETLMEWLSSERAESERASQPKGRSTAFRIDWSGFASVQDKRKERGEEIAGIVGELLERFHLS